jgi:hypothetical protein
VAPDQLVSVMVVPHGMSRDSEVELRIHRSHRTRTREISVPDVSMSDGTRAAVREMSGVLTESLDDQALYSMSRYAK